jgi:NAD(P)-dependent dehydrogenase (short-subunit alcohol dehydrogenase family)
MLTLERGGSIITTAPVAAKNPEAGSPPYCVSKAGVWMLTKQAARCLGSAGIRVNAIGPNLIETNMSAMLKEIPGALHSILSTLAIQRVGLPVDVANAAVFLASEESSYFTGGMLQPDGGYPAAWQIGYRSGVGGLENRQF